MGVRCADCGYLAVRDRTDRKLVEVEAGLRERWELPTLLNSNLPRYEDFPVCLFGLAVLRIDAPSYRREEVAALVRQERECDGFTPWRRGLSPKEHHEMVIAQELQRQQDRRDAEQRAWLAAESDKARRWQERQNRANRIVQIFLALFAAAVTGLLAYLGYHVDRLGQVPAKNQPTITKGAE